MQDQKRDGFTLIELTIAITIVAMIAAVAIPTYVSARTSANETRAIAALRHIASAQAQLIACCAVDSNANGGGEAGYFGELTGATPVRVFDGAGPALGGPFQRLDPDLLGVRFERILSDGTDGIAMVGGYYFKMFLPDASTGAPIAAVAESPTGGASATSLPGATNSERMWACYAWPIKHGRTGHRAFFVNQDGEVFATQNYPAQPGGSYSGLERIPAADAIFSSPADISAALATGSGGVPSQDQLLWGRVGG